MESKLKEEAVSQYSSAFSDKMQSQAFQQKEKLNGQDILGLTPLKQINLFVIKELFFHWKSEVEQLKSPYFNYQAEEVKSALASFMDVVSQNILINKHHLRPLLEKATKDTLYLVLAPYDYFYLLLTHANKQSWTVSELEEILKYVRINRTLLERLLDKCRHETLHIISTERITELFNQVFEQVQEPPEDTEPYIQQLSQEVPLQTETLFSNTTTSYSSPQVNEPYITQEEPPKEEKKEEGPRTLNDYLNKSDRSTLADMHQQRKIESLSSHISVNQKFMFVRELFNNDPEAFRQILEEIDSQNTYAEAVGLIRRDFAPQYQWKMDSEEVMEFMELLSKRF
ncbi:hypothetical protein OKW21_006336 [Catalinimonas alkaloidigena]|uniref:hypothetical protein n=1 Tax=Catalinimonas alkaloidigena TaxID=1075417 RepID=UPI0024066BE8|nr:hypothetical protein [Catalinimonas alkaloidigena]MDF9801073.1 hypothetical protein [Catalinimonas alkaloidigena]